MRILDRYIIKEFLRYYFLFLLFFVAIFVLTDFFTSMSHFKKEADIFQIIFYYLLQIPYLIILLSPLSIIISTLFTLSYFGSTNQLKAIQISGLSLKRATFPIFAAGIIIGFSSLFLENTVVFKTNQISQRIKEENFTTVQQAKIQKNIFIAVPPDFIFYIRSFRVEEGVMEDVMIYKNSSPPLLVIAKEGIWKEGVWVFQEGIEYVLKEIPEGKKFIKKIFGLKKEPRFFTRTYFPPEKMNISTLASYIQEYKKSGFETSDLETELQFKISSPFANFILMFLTVPLGIILKRGRGASFAVGLLLSFGYYETMAFFKALGKIGAADPFFSAWITNFLFILIGIILLWKME